MCGAFGGRGAPGAAGRWAVGFVGLLGTGYFLGLAWWEAAHEPLGAVWVTGGIGGLVFLAFVCVLFREHFVESFAALQPVVLGVLLFGLLYSYLLRIYHLDDGTLIGAVFLLGVKGTDIVAYLLGTAIGRHKFLAVSPGKSVEGSTAALVFGALWFSGAGACWPGVFFDWSWGIAFGIILAVTSALGDLAESLLKRSYRVKDSGSLLPEFGGVLDMIDSFLFSGFLFWILVTAEHAPWK